MPPITDLEHAGYAACDAGEHSRSMSGYSSSKPGSPRTAGAHASSAERTYLAASSGLCWSSHSEYCAGCPRTYVGRAHGP